MERIAVDAKLTGLTIPKKEAIGTGQAEVVQG
jgi:hypothetical protein